jgi:hypothetical protein
LLDSRPELHQSDVQSLIAKVSFDIDFLGLVDLSGWIVRLLDRPPAPVL